MKKLLLLLAAGTLSAAAVNAQSRLVLYEEFSGENCGPCALYNPGLTTLLNANTGKVLLLKYQSPIPTAGPIFNAYTTVTNARLTYYGVSSAPFGIQDGNEVTGNIASYTQANINSGAGVTSPFNISVNHIWNAAGDSVTANITITANAAYAPAGANLKMRVALVEHLTYCTAPGNNGETDFHNVVREMYPDAGGTQLPNAWTATQTMSFTIKGSLHSYIDKSNSDAAVVVFIQNDADKSIPQAAKSTRVSLPLDGALTGCSAPALNCATGSASIGNTATLQNTGSTTLTSAAIYYRVDNNTPATYNWTGSLAAGASTTVTLPAATLAVGSHAIYDSIASLNGGMDINRANNARVSNVQVRNSTPVALPIAADFENGLPANWGLFDADGNGFNWALHAATGHSTGSNAIYHNNFVFPSGEANYAILPNPALSGNSALDFWVAYAQYATGDDDQLEVVYSTNCGTSWASLWSASGDKLSTHAPVGSNKQFTPAAGDWVLHSINMTAVPAGAIIALRATSDYGNNLYVDDINLRAGSPAGVNNVITNGQVSLYPNPARESVSLDFSLAKSGKVVVHVIDAVGRTVAVAADATMQQGAQHLTLSTAALSAGVYNIAIRTEEGAVTQRLSVVK